MKTAIATLALTLATVVGFSGTAEADNARPVHGVKITRAPEVKYVGTANCIKVGKQTYKCVITKKN